MLQTAVEQFQQEFIVVKGYHVDISVEMEVENGISQVEKDFQQIDILIQSDGILWPTVLK